MSKTALVTGASRGIGLETAKKFLASDSFSNLILLARDSDEFTEQLKILKKDSKSLQKNVISFAVDVGDHKSLAPILKEIYEDVGNIDLLVNNAGYTNPVPIHQIDFDDFERTMAVNLYAPFRIIQDLLHLGNTFDTIVNIASTAGINGRSGWLTYSVSKAALINMSQVLREELQIYGTRVVCISPGRTATALRKTLAPDEDPSTIMQPEHVAEVIEMLSTPVGKFIDSENIIVRL